MDIAVKFPSRNRPNLFLKRLNELRLNTSSKNTVTVFVTVDRNDSTFNRSVIHHSVALTTEKFKIKVIAGDSKGKIDAVNRDMEYVCRDDWKLLLLMSDDMSVVKYEWDECLLQELNTLYPDTDGVLFHNDGYLSSRLNTMPIMGRKYFERFGYIYHPSYNSLWCDNEFTEVGYALKKQTYIDEIFFKHEHPMNTRAVSTDALYKKNDSYFNADKNNYLKRKARNFYITAQS
jgi:hypothetical protein